MTDRMRTGAPWLATAATLAAIVPGAAAARADDTAAARQDPKASGSRAEPEGGPRRRAYANPPDSKVGTLPPGTGVAVGEQAPDAPVRDADGRQVRLRHLTKSGPVLLVFYRGGWCPYCNSQIHELTTAYPEYRKRGVMPVAISVDRVEESAKTQATYAIPFPVLSDPDLAAHRAYRVLQQVDEAEFARLKGFGIDLEKASGRAHHVIAVPSIFLIDAKGVVRWVHADPDYKVRPSTAQVLSAIDRLGLRQQ